MGFERKEKIRVVLFTLQNLWLKYTQIEAGHPVFNNKKNSNNTYLLILINNLRAFILESVCLLNFPILTINNNVSN